MGRQEVYRGKLTGETLWCPASILIASRPVLEALSGMFDNVKSKVTEAKFIRAIFLPLFARCNPGDITIRHHYTGDRIRLHSFRHKGYWFHGARREASTMAMFRRILKQGDTVIEVGGHIGYISLFFRELIGEGRLIVFEPGPNNLPYLERNIQGKNIEVVQKAVGSQAGLLPFFIDGISGQNNSLVKDFYIAQINSAYAFDPKAAPSHVVIEVIQLDSFISGHRLSPDFIKIDIEGFEYDALQGMVKTLSSHRPALMVEFQMNKEKASALLRDLGYQLFQPNGLPSRPLPLDNTFCLHKDRHRALIESLNR